jgi:hypothetical protein
MALTDDVSTILTRNPELARVEAEIDRARGRVADSVIALRNEVARRGDWRGWVRRRPGLLLAGAFAIGFLWGRGRTAAFHIPTTQRRTWTWN